MCIIVCICSLTGLRNRDACCDAPHPTSCNLLLCPVALDIDSSTRVLYKCCPPTLHLMFDSSNDGDGRSISGSRTHFLVLLSPDEAPTMQGNVVQIIPFTIGFVRRCVCGSGSITGPSREAFEYRVQNRGLQASRVPHCRNYAILCTQVEA